MEENNLNQQVVNPTQPATPVVPTTETPVAQQPVAPVETQPVPAEPVTEVEDKQFTDPTGDSITFDYNQLYTGAETSSQAKQTAEETQQPVIEQTEIVLEQPKKEEPAPQIVKDVVPTFDVNALQGDTGDDTVPPVQEEQLIQSVAPGQRKEETDGKQNILFIIVFFAILIIAVLLIFPSMVGIR